MRVLHFFWLALFPLTGVLGCGSSAAGICDEICDCEGCSDAELDECIDSVEDAEKLSEDEGCTDQFDALADCVADQLECRDSNSSYDGCDKEETELANCQGSSLSVGGNVCDRAVDICGGGASSENGECTGQAREAAACIVDLNTCDVSNNALADCLNNI